MLVRLVYVSYAKTVMDDEEIAAILEKSNKNNRRDSITGVLLYSNRYFFQCLEGERTKVNQTYLRIANDVRHNKCVQIQYSDIDTRLFSGWAMEHVAFNGLADQLMLKYSETGLFHPYEFSAGQSLSLLTEIAESRQKLMPVKKSLFTWFSK